MEQKRQAGNTKQMQQAQKPSQTENYATGQTIKLLNRFWLQCNEITLNFQKHLFKHNNYHYIVNDNKN